jgi:hypothetical protein
MMQGPGRSKAMGAEGNDHRNVLCPVFIDIVEDINLLKSDTVVENDKSQMTCVILVDIFINMEAKKKSNHHNALFGHFKCAIALDYDLLEPLVSQ